MVVSELRGLLVSGGCFQNDSDVTEGAHIYDCSQLVLPSCRPVVLGKENVSVTKSLPSLGRAVAKLLPWYDCNVSVSLLDLQFSEQKCGPESWRLQAVTKLAGEAPGLAQGSRAVICCCLDVKSIGWHWALFKS